MKEKILSPISAASQREERLAASLRANLRRRKAQQEVRSDSQAQPKTEE